MKGESVDGDFFVLDRMDSYTFRYSKVREETVDGKKEIVVVMKPASAFLRMLVDPIYFHFEEDGSHVRWSEGRTPPKKEVKGSFKDLDAETVYSY
jgi:hypothetical protein